MANELSAELGIPAAGTDSFEDAVSGADVVCACTHADSPVLMGRWLKPGAHVNSVGLNFQGREMDDETVRLVERCSWSHEKPRSPQVRRAPTT